MRQKPILKGSGHVTVFCRLTMVFFLCLRETVKCQLSVVIVAKKIQPVDHQQIGLVVHYCFINQMNPGAYETCAFSLFSITVDMKFIVDWLFGYVIVIPKVTKVSSEALKDHSFNLNRLVHNNHNLEVSVFCLTRVKRTLESLCVIHVAYIKVTFCQPERMILHLLAY